MSEASKSRLRAEVRGRVQGVGYRQFVVSAAADFGLVGWVRNDPNHRDRVEVEAEGTRGQLELLLQKLRIGPFGARVSHVAVQWDVAIGGFDCFEVRY